MLLLVFVVFWLMLSSNLIYTAPNDPGSAGKRAAVITAMRFVSTLESSEIDAQLTVSLRRNVDNPIDVLLLTPFIDLSPGSELIDDLELTLSPGDYIRCWTSQASAPNVPIPPLTIAHVDYVISGIERDVI